MGAGDAGGDVMAAGAAFPTAPAKESSAKDATPRK